MARYKLDPYGEFDGDFVKTPEGFAYVFGDGTALPFTWAGKGMPEMGEPCEAPEGEAYAPTATCAKDSPREIVLALSVIVTDYIAPYRKAQEERAEQRKRDERHRKALERALRKAGGKSIRY